MLNFSFIKANMQDFKIIIFIYAYIYATVERLKSPIYLQASLLYRKSKYALEHM